MFWWDSEENSHVCFRDIMGKTTGAWGILNYWPCTYNPRENGCLMGFSKLMKDKCGLFPSWLFRCKAPMWGIIMWEFGPFLPTVIMAGSKLVPCIRSKSSSRFKQLCLSWSPLYPNNWGWIYTVIQSAIDSITFQSAQLPFSLVSYHTIFFIHDMPAPLAFSLSFIFIFFFIFSSTPRFPPYGLWTCCPLCLECSCPDLSTRPLLI